MQDLEQRLKELGDSASRHAPSELRPTARALRRIRVGRAVRNGAVLATVAALVVGGFAGARSLTNDEALLPTEEDSNVIPFVDTWTTRTDVDGRTRTMVIQASGDDAYEISVQNHRALVCSGAPSTLKGTGQLVGSTELVVVSPEITCDDGSEPKVADDLPPAEELLRNLTFEYDPESDILTNFSPLEGRHNRGENRGDIFYGRTLIWGRAEAENRIGDVSGWVTYGSKRSSPEEAPAEQGIWARDLTSPGDPADRVLLSSTPGTPIAWSRDGSKLLVMRDVPPTGLFVVNSDGAETRLTDANGSMGDSGSFSPDGTAVVYAVTRECWWRSSGCGEGNLSSAIYVVAAEGGSPRVLLTAGSRRYPDDCGTHTCMPGRFETALQEPKWSPDGSQIAYFDGMFDWGNSLRVMDSDGTDSRVVVENSETLGGGHVYGLDWSPDGSQLAFSIEERLYVVGVDGSGFRLVSDQAVDPYWSPDGSHIAYTRPDENWRGSLEIVRLDDLQIQNFGHGGSGPWTAEMEW
ncbi:MAG: TolB family protein [Actinomycetota bacterium]